MEAESDGGFVKIFCPECGQKTRVPTHDLEDWLAWTLFVGVLGTLLLARIALLRDEDGKWQWSLAKVLRKVGRPVVAVVAPGSHT